MEIRYDRDLRHNYMVLCGAPAGDDYRMKMFAAGTPEGMLPCSMRHINGEIYLYYGIDSRQSIRNRFAGSGMGAREFGGLMRAIIKLADTLEDYLLDMDNVLFSADCIYADMRKENFYFAYCPFSASVPGEETSFSAFAQGLLDLIDPDDEKAAIMAYSLCGMADTGSMLIADMAKAALEEAEEEQNKEQEPAGEEVCRECISIAQETPSDADYEAMLAAMDEGGPLPAPRKKKLPMVTGILSVAVFAGNLVVRRLLYLNRIENLLSLAVAGASLIATTVSLLLILKGAGTERGTDGSGAQDAGIGPTEHQPVRLEEAVLSGSFPSVHEKGEITHHTPLRIDAAGAADEDQRTTVLDVSIHDNVSKLYGRNGEETINIMMEKLPCTIGKLAGAADQVINDSSVSRMHVRFSGDGSGQATRMQDLNSTNGTWLNGRRLKPNETVDIRPGDEIGLGRLLFEFR